MKSSPSDHVDAVRALARVTRLLERASGDLNLAHYRVLVAIASGEERASRVAARLALGKPAISASVESLAQRGLISRSNVAGDQRAAALSVTSAGLAMLAEAERSMVSALDEVCARVDDPDHVVRSLVALGDGVERLHIERVGGEGVSPR
ncbi:MAG TPA: MarR family winged helix-turn-helix transcriptional regulator [Ilumatobacteraceae bacterium]